MEGRRCGVRGVVGGAVGLAIALAAAWVGDWVARREAVAPDGRGERFHIALAPATKPSASGASLRLRLVEVSWSLEAPGETWGEEVVVPVEPGETVSFEASLDLDPGPEPYEVRPAIRVVPHPPGVRTPSLRRAEAAEAARAATPASAIARIDLQVPPSGGSGRVQRGWRGSSEAFLAVGADSLLRGVPAPLLLAAGRRGHVLLAWLDEGATPSDAVAAAWQEAIRRAVGTFAADLAGLRADFGRLVVPAETAGQALATASWIPVPGLERVLGDVLATLARHEESWGRSFSQAMVAARADAETARYLLGVADPGVGISSLLPPEERFAGTTQARALRFARLLAASGDSVAREAWAFDLHRFESGGGGPWAFLRRSLAHGSAQGRWTWPAWAEAMADEGWPASSTDRTGRVASLPGASGPALLIVLFVVAGAAASLLRGSGDPGSDGRLAAAWLFAAGLALSGLRVEIRGVDTHAEAAGFLLAGWGGGLLVSRLAGWGARAAVGGILGAALLLAVAEAFDVAWPIRLGVALALLAPLVARSLGERARRGVLRSPRDRKRRSPATAEVALRWLLLLLFVLGAYFLLTGGGSSADVERNVALLAAIAPIAGVGGILAARRAPPAPGPTSPSPVPQVLAFLGLLGVVALVSSGIVDFTSRRGARAILRDLVAEREELAPAARREAERLLEAGRTAEAVAVLEASLVRGPGDREETLWLLAVANAESGDLLGAEAAMRGFTRGTPERLQDLALRVSDRVEAWMRRPRPRTEGRAAALIGALLLQGAAPDERFVARVREQPGLPSSLVSALLRSPAPTGAPEPASDAARRFLAAERLAALLATRGARALAADLAAFAEDPATPAAARTAAVEILCRVGDLPFTLIPADRLRPGVLPGARTPQADAETEVLALSLWAEVRSLPRAEGLRRRLDVAFERLTDAEGQDSPWLRRHVGDFAANAETWRAWWAQNRGLPPRQWLTNGHPLRDPPPEWTGQALLDVAFPPGGVPPAESAPTWRSRLWHLLALAAPEEADVPVWGAAFGDRLGRGPWVAEPPDGFTPWCAALGVTPTGQAVRAARFRLGAESEPPFLLETWATPVRPGEEIRLTHGKPLYVSSGAAGAGSPGAPSRLHVLPAGLPRAGRPPALRPADEERLRQEQRGASPIPPLVVAHLRLVWRAEEGLAVVSMGSGGRDEFRLREPLGAGRAALASVGAPRFPLALAFDRDPQPGDWSREDWQTRFRPQDLATVRTEVLYLPTPAPSVPARLPLGIWAAAAAGALLGVLGLVLRKRSAGPLLAAGATVAGVLLASVGTGVAALDPWPSALGLAVAALGTLGLLGRSLGRAALLAPAWFLAAAVLTSLDGAGLGPAGLGVAGVVWASLGLVALPFLLRDPDARAFEAAGRGARLSAPAVLVLALLGLAIRLDLADGSSPGSSRIAPPKWTGALGAYAAWGALVLLLLVLNARTRRAGAGRADAADPGGPGVRAEA